MENIGPVTTDRSKKKVVSAHEVLQEVMSTGGSVKDDTGSEAGSFHSQKPGSQKGEGEGQEEEQGEEVDGDSGKMSVKTIKRVLELLCDESVS